MAWGDRDDDDSGEGIDKRRHSEQQCKKRGGGHNSARIIRICPHHPRCKIKPLWLVGQHAMVRPRARELHMRKRNPIPFFVAGLSIKIWLQTTVTWKIPTMWVLVTAVHFICSQVYGFSSVHKCMVASVMRIPIFLCLRVFYSLGLVRLGMDQRGLEGIEGD